MKHQDDHTHITDCLNGNREAFRELVVRYQKHVYYALYRMIHDSETARDLSQEVFIKAYTGLHTYDARFSFKVWITRIAFNQAIDYLRRRRPEYLFSSNAENPDKPTAIDRALSRQPPPDETVLWKEQSDILVRAVKELPPRLRIVIILRHFEDMNYDEIAEVLNIPMGTVKNRLFKARERLQKRVLGDPVLVQEGVS